MSSCLAFLAGAVLFASAPTGTPATAATTVAFYANSMPVPTRYVWPIKVTQPMTVGFNAAGSKHVLAASCTVTQNGSVVGTGSTPETPYAISTTPGGSVSIHVTVNGSNTAAPYHSTRQLKCVVTVVGSNPTAMGQSTQTFGPVNAEFPPASFGVTMPNITITKPH